MDPRETADAYLATWNAPDPAALEALLARCWHADATYLDPLMSGHGAAQIQGLVLAVRQRFPAFRFQLRGTPDGHGPHRRLAWSLGEPGQPAPIEGSDLIELREGRIARVIGFIDKAPAA